MNERHWICNLASNGGGPMTSDYEYHQNKKSEKTTSARVCPSDRRRAEKFA